MTQTSQQYTRSVIVEFYLANGLQMLESILVLHSLIIYTILAMISFREDISKPDGCQTAIGKSFVMPMITNMFVYDFGHVQVLHQPYE